MRRTRASATTALSGRGIVEIDAPIEVRRHPGARRLTLRVSRTRRAVIVTLPVQCDLDEAGSFLNRNIDWVRERLDSLPAPVPFRHGIYMPLRGDPHVVMFRGPARGERAAGRPQRAHVVERIPAAPYPALHVSGEPEHAPRRLRDWLMEEARRDLSLQVARHARKLGLSAKRIAIRDQSSRWGSCSTTGVLSFSWRLILAPPAILDYVAAHEVAHLDQMNHGPRFWDLVRTMMPEMDEAKRWLQIYGMDLHRYGAEDTG